MSNEMAQSNDARKCHCLKESKSLKALGDRIPESIGNLPLSPFPAISAGARLTAVKFVGLIGHTIAETSSLLPKHPLELMRRGTCAVCQLSQQMICRTMFDKTADCLRTS